MDSRRAIPYGRYGQLMVGLWSAWSKRAIPYGRLMVGLWSAYGRLMVSLVKEVSRLDHKADHKDQA